VIGVFVTFRYEDNFDETGRAEDRFKTARAKLLERVGRPLRNAP